MAATTSLSLNGLRLPLFLGVYPEEQLKKQTITIDSQICFPQPLPACFSDRLEDTFCYDKLVTYLKAHLEDKKFQLVEYLTQEIHRLIKAYFPVASAVSVRVTKLPQISELGRGVTFEYSDKATAWSS